MGCGSGKNNNRLSVYETKHVSTSSSPASPCKIESLSALRIHAGFFLQHGTNQLAERYQSLQLLGQGAFGLVYRAENCLTHDFRAIKIFKNRAKFRISEAEILGRLDHPNIVKIYEVGEDQEGRFMVLELCTGGDLLKYARKQGRLEDRQAADVMRQVISAVAYCHERGIAHCDLKPENLLLASESSDDSFPTIKLIDFGSAILCPNDRSQSQGIGSLSYMSPEMIDGDYDQKCDVWSCGVILYVLLTGIPPFSAQNDEDLKEKIRREDVKFQGIIGNKIDPDAKKLIFRMLDRNPKTRFSITECMSSAWLKTYDVDASFALPVQVQSALTHLAGFSTSAQLRNAFFCFIATHFSHRSDILQIAEEFRVLDRDGDGCLTREDIIEALKQALPYQIAVSFSAEILQKVDIDGNGTIDFSEFLLASADRKKLLSTENLKAAFDAIDLDKSGKISGEELKVLLQSHGDLSPSVLTQLIAQADRNHDGEIEFSEFQELMQNPEFQK